MKALLTITTSIVAASLAMGISTTAIAQESSVQLSGEISLGWSGFEADTGSDFGDISEQTGSLDFSFDVTASAPEYGMSLFGYADMSAAVDDTAFNDMDVELISAAIGASGAQGAVLARVGARETSYAYASDLAVGGAGVSTKFLDEANGGDVQFNGIELIYAHAQGPISFSGAYEPETGKFSGAAGYDFATLYGPARINGYAFEDQMNNEKDDVDAIRGYRVGGFVDNGALELGGNISVEDIEFASTHAVAGLQDVNLDRVSYAVGAVLAVQGNLDLSVDYEQTETHLNGTKTKSNAFSIGAEMSYGDALTVGGYMKQFEDTPVLDLFGADAGVKTKSGSEVGLKVGISF